MTESVENINGYGLIINPSEGDLMVGGLSLEGDEVAVTLSISSVKRVAGSRIVTSEDGELKRELCAIRLNNARSAEVIGNMFWAAANKLRENNLSWSVSFDKSKLEE